MKIQKLGIIGTSTKEDERRVPFHPDHLRLLPDSVRTRLVFEKGYGTRFGIPDAELTAQTGGVATRKELLGELGSVLLLKPEAADLKDLREGGILWGYPHCAQQRATTQTAIDRRQTLIAFEDMYVWGPGGQIGRHTFYKNNEMAGYCAVLHALSLKGIDGHYGKPYRTLIFGYGTVSRGAIYALKALGFTDITVCIMRPDYAVKEELPGPRYVRIREGQGDEPRMVVVDEAGQPHALCDLISQADILINGTFQDVNRPVHYVTESEFSSLKNESLIIDVSCDEKMAFFFAKPTSFKEPMFRVGAVDYYAVDHTPSYLWDSASRSISAALLEFIPCVLGGHDSWHQNETIRNAINLENGVIQKPSILSFQNREKDYPHAIKYG